MSFIAPEQLAAKQLRQAEHLPKGPNAVQLHVQCDGTIDQPDFHLLHGWREPSGQPVLGARRIGCWLQIGSSRSYRLPDHLFPLSQWLHAGLVEAVVASRSSCFCPWSAPVV